MEGILDSISSSVANLAKKELRDRARYAFQASVPRRVAGPQAGEGRYGRYTEKGKRESDIFSGSILGPAAAGR